MCNTGQKLFKEYDRLAFLYLREGIYELKERYEEAKQLWKAHQEGCETCMLKPKFHSTTD